MPCLLSEKLKKTDEALAHYFKLIKIAPSNETARIGLGKLQLSLGDVKEALGNALEVMNKTSSQLAFELVVAACARLKHDAALDVCSLFRQFSQQRPTDSQMSTYLDKLLLLFVYYLLIY